MERWIVEIKRKIAWVLLICMLAGLLSSFSFLLAMEPVIIKDVNGVQFELSEDQKNALQKCKALRPFLLAEEKHEELEKDVVDFSGLLRPFITQANITQLANLITYPILRESTNDENVIEMFQLADYLMAPYEVVQKLRQDARKVIKGKMAHLKAQDSHTQEQSAELLNLQIAEQARKNGQIDVNKLVEKIEKKNIPINNLGLVCAGSIFFRLEYKNTKKILKSKLESLNGLEKLGHYLDAKYNDSKVELLALDDQNFQTVDLGVLQERYTQLSALYLENNLIEKISATKKVRGLRVELNRNPLKSITIEKPELYDELMFYMPNDSAVKLDFNQNNYNKMNRSVLKIDFIRNNYSNREPWVSFYEEKDCLMVPMGKTNEEISPGITLRNCMSGFWVYKKEKKGSILKKKIAGLLKVKKLANLVEKYGPKACISMLRNISGPTLRASCEFFNKPAALLGVAISRVATFITSGINLSTNCFKRVFNTDYRMPYKQDSERNIKCDSHRIQLDSEMMM